MRSSYIENGYDEIFTAIVRGFQPSIAIEIGVPDGYSLCAIAEGVKHNRFGHVYAYDLFEDYQFNHGSKEVVEEILKERGLSSYVTLNKEDAYSVHNHYGTRDVHFLHVDISNNGNTVNRIMELWDSKIPYGGIICFEGGTVERDNISWMIKYDKPPIKQAIETDPILNSKYVYCTYLDFPGLTVCLKKRE